MNRAIFGGSLLSVIILLIGTFAWPSSLVMELASTSAVATTFRILMAASLLLVLFTSPPRHLYVRIAMGAVAALFLVVALAMSLGNSMHLLDVILFFQLGSALGIEALEFNDDELEERTKNLHKLYKTQSRAAHAK